MARVLPIITKYYQGFPQSPEFQKTKYRSVLPTNFEIPASSDKAETQRKWHRWDKSQMAVLVNSWKENFSECLQPKCLG